MSENLRQLSATKFANKIHILYQSNPILIFFLNSNQVPLLLIITV